jgi:hypothetical protein
VRRKTGIFREAGAILIDGEQRTLQRERKHMSDIYEDDSGRPYRYERGLRVYLDRIDENVGPARPKEDNGATPSPVQAGNRDKSSTEEDVEIAKSGMSANEGTSSDNPAESIQRWKVGEAFICLPSLFSESRMFVIEKGDLCFDIAAEEALVILEMLPQRIVEAGASTVVLKLKAGNVELSVEEVEGVLAFVDCFAMLIPGIMRR